MSDQRVVGLFCVFEGRSLRETSLREGVMRNGCELLTCLSRKYFPPVLICIFCDTCAQTPEYDVGIKLVQTFAW